MVIWWNALSDSFGLLGWVLVLVGFLLNRSAMAKLQLRVSNHVSGSGNKVTNNVNQNVTSIAHGGSDGLLATWGSWASILGLALSLWPTLKGWLVVAT
ncbi:hypothetical protein [Hydrogenophaga sp.]|uniref:hypothetical protein n=1 Tax=Hydrogenophaga sp. TaxID=1904254 RepID=UPI002AB80C80|nr:hypothetical protein [Hydrogenophaga sp.]MDZ4400781.1 hypothetical protein [Hydrogenophaga sp.]